MLMYYRQAEAVQQHIGMMQLTMNRQETEMMANVLYLPYRIIGEFCQKNEHPAKMGCTYEKLGSCFNSQKWGYQITTAPFYGWEPVCKYVYIYT